MKKNEIYLKQGADYRQMAIDLLEACNLSEDIGDKKKRIGIKPNLVVTATADRGAVTHPEIVDGVLTYLKDHGFHNLVVLEGSWVGDRTENAVKVSGIFKVCQQHDVSFFDTQKDTFTKKTADGIEIAVCDEALKLDYLINLPVLKGHCQTLLTCALKNMKGLIPNAEKRRFHRMGLHRPIACVNRILRQDFVLVDNICGDLDFEEGGNPVPMNRLIGGRDPVLIDSFAAQTMGYQPEDIDYIVLANELGVGSMELEYAVIRDLSPEGAKEKQAKPEGIVKKLSSAVRAGDACSACYGSLIYALNRLRQEGRQVDTAEYEICIGQAFRGQKGDIGIGNCTRLFAHSLKGCPPKAVDIIGFLKEQDIMISGSEG